MILKTNPMEQKDYFENTLETIGVYGFKCNINHYPYRFNLKNKKIMNALHLEYKKDTGKYIEVGDEFFIPKREITNLQLKYFEGLSEVQETNMQKLINEIISEYTTNICFINSQKMGIFSLIDPQYISWLENKVNELQKG
jgi:hypothetical protein